MNANLARAVRGLIILITIGTLFAIDHFGSYPFEQTWPILIIIIGLLKLMERAIAPTPPPPPNYPPSSYPSTGSAPSTGGAQ